MTALTTTAKESLADRLQELNQEIDLDAGRLGWWPMNVGLSPFQCSRSALSTGRRVGKMKEPQRSQQLNSLMQNRTQPICCELGDEEMERLWSEVPTLGGRG